MKNIQRFKLPVFVAAGLHGALFLSLPPTPVVSLNGSVIAEKPLPLPPTKIIEMSDPDRTDGDLAAAGGSALSTLPDNPVERPAPDAFTIPVVSMDRTPGPAITLAEPPGGPGDGPGSWTGTRVSPSDIVDLSALDRVPRATVQPAPNYPSPLRHEGVTGSVTIAFVVDREGRVVRAEALRSTHREFVEPAIRAVMKWRFEPGKHHGRPTSFRMAVPIEFALGNE